MKKISRDTSATFIIGALIITANSWHVITEWLINKPNEVFTAVSHYFIDYFFYISHIVQGANGAWLYTRHMFTNEPLTPTWIYWLYTILGKFSSIGVNPFTVYNISIVAFSALTLILWWKMLRVILPDKPLTRLVAFLFITTASNFPGLGDFWFSPTPALNRLGGVPHQIFQTIVLLLTMYLFSLTMHPKQLLVGRKRTVMLGSLTLVSFISATVSPIQMLLVVAATALLLIITGKGKMEALHLISFSVLAAPALAGAYLTNGEFARQQILVIAKSWENSQHISVTLWQFILAVGPISICIPFGIKPFAQKTPPLRMLLGIFSLLSLILFFSPVPRLLGTASVRWLSPASYGALPILAALGFEEIVRLTKRSVLRQIPSPSVFSLLLVIYLLVTIPSLINQIHARVSPLRNDRVIASLNHIPFAMRDAFVVIKKDSRDGVIMTDPVLTYDTVIPIFTGKRTLTGQPVHTLYPQVKEHLRTRFFSGTMSELEAKQFITDHDIDYILASSGASRSLPTYAFMSEIFHNEAASVYVTYKK